jgi:DNA-binding PadR family transcriptional regulator
MNATPKKPEKLLPLAQQAYAILIALANGPRHGYDIKRFSAEIIGFEIPTQTLYRYIHQLHEEELIEVDEEKSAASENPRRCYYKLSHFGMQVFVAETNRLTMITNLVIALLEGRPAVVQRGDHDAGVIQGSDSTAGSFAKVAGKWSRHGLDSLQWDYAPLA